MVIETLTLKNLGLYAGETTIDLTPKSAEQPVVLVGGLNGRGKTTMRNAILLCLHGSNAQCSNRGGKGYNQYLASLISKSAKPGETTSVTLTYHRKVAGKVQRLKVSRSWDKIDGEIEEKFTVHILPDDKAMEIDPTLATNWNEHIEGYFPASLASLFFFDGEDIVRLSDQKETRELIQSALNGLLGLNLIERLDTDLTRYIGNLVKESSGSAEQVAFQKAEDELKEAVAEADRCQNEADIAQKNHAKSSKALEEADKRYVDSGGKLQEQSKVLQEKEIKMREEIEALRETFRELAEGPAFLLLAKPLLNTACIQAGAETNIRRSCALADHDEHRDKSTVKKISERLGKSVDANVIAEILASTRTNRPNSGDVILDADDKLEPKLELTVRQILPTAKADIDKLLRDTHAANAELDEIRHQLMNVPDAELIKLLRKRKEEASDENLSTKAQFDYCTERLKAAMPRLVKAQNAKDNAESSFRGLKEIQSKKLRAEQARESIRRFKAASTCKKLDQVSELITDAFLRLVGKESLIKSIGIDHATLELVLTKPDGGLIEFDQLSSGERQILAYAVLWGLSKVSGRPLPTVIDTPMGRLDEKHRMNLAENYFHQASHQVIILSTDTEIFGKYLEAMRHGVGNMYSLQFNEQTRSTQILEGYFS
jgi:DNA sulfur modification protein DndD